MLLTTLHTLIHTYTHTLTRVHVYMHTRTHTQSDTSTRLHTSAHAPGTAAEDTMHSMHFNELLEDKAALSETVSAGLAGSAAKPPQPFRAYGAERNPKRRRPESAVARLRTPPPAEDHFVDPQTWYCMKCCWGSPAGPSYAAPARRAPCAGDLWEPAVSRRLRACRTPAFSPRAWR